MSHTVAPGTRVLVIDDYPSIRELVSMMLEFEGYTVDTAEDGVEGLIKAYASPPDAIILDLIMPVLGGRDFIAAWHEQPAEHTAPIMVMSGVADLLRAEDLGAQGHVSKPFKRDALMSELRAMLAATPAATMPPTQAPCHGAHGESLESLTGLALVGGPQPV